MLSCIYMNIKRSYAPVSRWSSGNSNADITIISTITSSCDLTTILSRESDREQMSSKVTDNELKKGFQNNRKSKLVGFTVSSREDLEKKIVSCYRYVFSLFDSHLCQRRKIDLCLVPNFVHLHHYRVHDLISSLSLPAPLLMLCLPAWVLLYAPLRIPLLRSWYSSPIQLHGKTEVSRSRLIFQIDVTGPRSRL